MFRETLGVAVRTPVSSDGRQSEKRRRLMEENKKKSSELKGATKNKAPLS